MASLINPGKIDATYPIAGQDNDTQGFRTNYQNIKNNFTVAASEITALQGNVTALQTQGYGNISVAAYLPTYTGNITAGNVITQGTTINNGIITTTLTLSSALQFANLTTTQVNAISTPKRGMTVYNYNTGNIQVYNGTKWANVTLS
jgi:hypothetical protein